MRKNRPSKRKIIISIIVALIAILAFWLVLRYIDGRGLLDEKFGNTGGWGDDDIEETFITIGDKSYSSLDDIDTYLLIGTDGGGDDLGEAYNGDLADFLVLLIVDNTTEKFGFYTIDRNTMTDVATTDENGEMNAIVTEQICLSHWYGLDDEERNFNTVDAVSTLLGVLDIDNYYTINMADINRINEAIGGVTVHIDTDMTEIDPAFRQGEDLLLTGDQAEKFIRARYALKDGTNAARMSRQQQYMENAYAKLINEFREDPGYVNDLYDQLDDCIISDGSAREVSVAVNHMMQYENMGFIKFDGETKINDTLGDGEDHEEFYADPDSIIEGLEKVINFKEAANE